MHCLFVASKPLFIGSNQFLSQLKRRDGVKKAGFSGILDPFACGCLIVAYGEYTKLLSWLPKSPKVYRATLWLGLESDSLDLERAKKVHHVAPFTYNTIQRVFEQFVGSVEFVPPKYSAKKTQGKRAYVLAREGKEVQLQKQRMEVFGLRLLEYCHPFVSFEAVVSEGAYIRSLGELIAKELGIFGALSYLERQKEGAFAFEQEKKLNPLEVLAFEKIDGVGLGGEVLKKKFWHGQKIAPWELKIQNEGKYIVYFEDFFSIISQYNHEIKYLLNRIPYAHFIA